MSAVNWSLAGQRGRRLLLEYALLAEEDSAVDVDWNFYSFAIVGLAGAITAVAVPRPRTRQSVPNSVTDRSLTGAAPDTTSQH